MTRRNLFEVIARALATACAAIVGIPAIRYLIDPLRRRPSAERGFQRLIRLDALAPGVPRELAVRDLRQDAWTLYPEETIGRVWIFRDTDESVPASETRLHVFTTQCPHLGCAVQLNADGKRFECPCHKAGFIFTGARMGDRELGHKNPAPRDLDSIDSQVVQDDESKEWWVEVRFQKFKQGLTMKVPVA